jgi:hypothetical protein
MDQSTLINREAAAAYLSEVGDPVIKTIMDMVNMIVLKKWKYPTAHRLGADLDLRFLAEVLVELFEDRERIKKVLAGERPGAWDDEET